MFGTVLLWLVYALFLKVAVALATDLDRSKNSLVRAFVTAAFLSVAHGVFAYLGSIFVWLWPLVWLFILKRSYEIGWGRAILVWLALVTIAIGLILLVLVPIGLVGVLPG